jgi:HD-GYP domain-containing protein (c-di-GMP phosphodiesterase class II)
MTARLENVLASVQRLTTAAANAALYSLDHRQVSHLCNQAQTHLRRALDDNGELSLMLVDDQLIFDNLPLENNLSVGQMIQGLKRQGIGTLKLLDGMETEEIRELVAVLARGPQKTNEAVSSRHIRYGKLEVHYAESSNNDGDSTAAQMFDQFPDLAEIQEEELAEFVDLYRAARKNQRLNVVGISDIVSGFVDAFSSNADPLLAIAPLRGLDEYTYTHSTNVCVLNLAQARLLGIEGQALHDIGVAAMLHDIGKLFVPPEILQKPGKLDDREWEIMQDHPRKGAEYLFGTPGVPRLAVVTAYEHHMRYDGTGYPKVSRPWQQHLVSQMTAISDFFDALRTNRSYSASLTLDVTAGIMLKQTGTSLHPGLTRNFLKAISQLDSLQ